MLSRKGGGQGQLVPGHPLATTRLLSLEVCVLLLCSAEQLTPHSAGPRETRHGLCIIVTVEKRRW